MKIAVTSPSFSRNEILRSEILKYFPDTKLNLQGQRFNKGDLIEFIQDADGIVLGLEPIDEEVLSKCPRLKIIAKYGVGLNNIDFQAVNKRGIKIGWTGGVNRLSVAEMALGFMLMLARNLYQTSNLLKQGTWKKNGGFQLSQKTVGIIGVGFIGKELVRLLKPFNCKILVNDIINQDDYYRSEGLIEVTKKQLYQQADFITIHTPLDDSTYKMLNMDAFKLMKRTAFVINTARGGIIDENDLKVALKEKIIAGAAIDVYENEPPEDMGLLSLPNFICTPHIGGNAFEAVIAMGMSAIKHLRDFFH